MVKTETKIKRMESLAKTKEEHGKKEWAKAKNGGEGWHYTNARKDFDKAKELREKANKLKKDS